MSNLRKGWKGTWKEYPREYELAPGYDQVFVFTADGQITAAMDGGTITNTGATGHITLTLPEATEGMTIGIIRDADYSITIEPYAGDTLLEDTEGFTIHSSELSVATVVQGNDWTVMLGAAPNLISSVYNVKAYGAIGDGSTDDTDAFKRAFSKCTTRGSVVAVPETDDGALPGYRITENLWDSLGTKTNTVPGTVMELGGRLHVSDQQILPGGARIIGRTSNNNNALSGSTIRAWSDFPNDGTSIVRIGRAAGLNGYSGSTDEPTDGTKLEWVTINGTGLGIYGNLSVGVSSTGGQERSGMENCIIIGTRHGFVARAGTNKNPSNYIMRAVDAWILPTVDGVGFTNDISGGGKFTWEKMTVISQYQSGIAATDVQDNGGFFQITLGSHPYGVNQRVRGSGFTGGGSTALNNTSPAYMTVTAVTSTTITVDVAYSSGWTSGGIICGNCYAGFGISGSDCRMENLHVECVEYGVEIANVNANFRTYGVLVDGMHGYNGLGSSASHPPMLAMARIRSVEDYVYDIELKRLSVNTPHGQTVMVQDDRNGVTIPMAEFHATNDNHLGRYYFGGTYENGAVGTPIPVECDRFDKVTRVSISSSTYDDYDLGRTGDLRITTVGGNVTITSFADGYLGRKGMVTNLGPGNVILDSSAASGTARNRIESATLADLTVEPGQRAVIDYGVGPTNYSVTVSTSAPNTISDGRWYAYRQ